MGRARARREAENGRWRKRALRILLVDDHVLFREGIALLLRPMLPGVDVLEAGTMEEAVEQTTRAAPAVDLVLMDLGLPGLSGLEGIGLFRERFPELPVVVLSSADDRETVLKAIDAGAMGYVPKSSSSGVLAGALQLIVAKGIYLPPSVFLTERAPVAPPGATPRPPGATRATPSSLGLTPRQADVLWLILEGKPAKMISRELNLSASTVKVHTSAVLRALNVTTRTQAVVAAGKLGLTFSPPPPPG
jgi:DNA-binding NarL/FixJ family response regulator